MGALGDLLELAATSSKRWSTLRAEVQQHTQTELMQRSIQRGQQSFGHRRDSPPGDPFHRLDGPAERTSTATVHAQGGARVRIEQHPVEPDGEAVLTVQNERRRWTRTGDGQVMVADLSGPFGQAPDPAGWSLLLDPAKLLAQGEAEPTGAGERDGRPTLGARVLIAGPTLTASAGGRGVFLFPGCFGDSFEAELDTATGLVLALRVSIDGQEFRTFTVTALAVDPELDPSLFDEEPPAEASVRPMHQMAEPVQAVAARVGFQIYQPDGAACTAFLPPPGKDAKPPVVQLHEMPSPTRPVPGPLRSFVQSMQSPSPDGLADPAEWTPMQAAGRDVHVWQPDGGGEVHARLEIDGTHLWIRGLDTIDDALTYIGRLVPVTPR